jgi:hypothetical protein
MKNVLCNKNLLFINKVLLNNESIKGSITVISTINNVALSDNSVTSLLCKIVRKNKTKNMWIHSYACDYNYDDNLYDVKVVTFPSGNISFESIKNNVANLITVLNISIQDNTNNITFLIKKVK